MPRQTNLKEVRMSCRVFPVQFIIYQTLDIPNLDLGHRASSPQDEYGSVSPTMSVSSTGADAPSPSSRRTSFSSNGRPGTSMSQRSRSSSRSTSFNLPCDARTGIRRRLSSDDLEFEDEPLMDEEGMSFSDRLICLSLFRFSLAAQRHAEFLRARGRHYSNEAEAMKVDLLWLSS